MSLTRSQSSFSHHCIWQIPPNGISASLFDKGGSRTEQAVLFPPTLIRRNIRFFCLGVPLVTVLAVIVSWSFPVEGKASGTDSESSHLRGLSVSQSAEAKQRKTLCLHGMIKPPFNVLFTFWGFYQLVRKRTGAKCEKAEFWILIYLFFFSSQFWFFFSSHNSEKKKSEFIFNFFLRILNFFTEFWKKKY